MRHLTSISTFLPGWLAFILVLTSCAGSPAPGRSRGQWISDDCFSMDSIELRIAHRNDTLHVVTLRVRDILRDSLLLPYPLYRFDCGDLTGDGLPEVALGVVKPARFWPTPEKRLFIYHLFRGWYIRPLWLGSRVGNPLCDFRIDRDSLPAQVMTDEWAPDSTLIHRRYRMGAFGLKFSR